MTSFTLKDKEKRALKGKITTLLNKLTAMNGPSAPLTKFIHANDHIKPSHESDALIGSLFMESVMSSAFNMAANDNQATDTATGSVSSLSFGIDDAMEAYSQYLQDEAKTEITDTSKRGKGTKALIGSHKTICNLFNAAPEPQKKPANLWEQMQIERALAYCADQLDQITAAERFSAPEPAFSM